MSFWDFKTIDEINVTPRTLVANSPSPGFLLQLRSSWPFLLPLTPLIGLIRSRTQQVLLLDMLAQFSSLYVYALYARDQVCRARTTRFGSSWAFSTPGSQLMPLVLI